MERPDHLLLNEREATEFRRSRRSYRIVLVGAFALLILLLVTLGPPVLRHIDAVAGFTLAGADVDWDLGRSNWTHGGVTRVTCSNGRNLIADSALPRFKNLHRVVAVDLSDCDLITATGLSVLRDLEYLEALDLSRTQPVRQLLEPDRPGQKLNDAALAPLQNLTRLTNLSLAGNLITDDGLAMLSGLTNLEYLDLSGTRVTDAGLKHLKGLKRLRTLMLADTKVTKKGALGLQETLTGLNEFNINSEASDENAGN